MSQLAETWSTNSIRATLWGTTLVGTGAASAATGALVLSESAGGRATVRTPGSTANHYDLTAADALASGVVLDVQSLTNGGGRFYFALLDATGLGWSFHYDPVAGSIYVESITAGSGDLESRIGANHGGISVYNPVTHRYWRFIKSAGDLLTHSSPDGVTWTAAGFAATIGAEVVTAMDVVLEVFAIGTPITATLGAVTVGGAGGGGGTATHLGLVKEARNGQARQANWIAATGKTFDYRIKLAAYDAGGAVDATFTG
jgi:hypothetical protein